MNKEDYIKHAIDKLEEAIRQNIWATQGGFTTSLNLSNELIDLWKNAILEFKS